MYTFIDLTKKKMDKLVFDKPGAYVVFMHNISGDFTFELREKCEVEIYGLFTGKNKDSYKINTVQHHIAPGSWSNLFIKGVFADESRFEYDGLIRIEKSGQTSHAYQKNQNLVLSPGVFVESNPNLEILANDVFCTHGSTTGRLNKEQLFYAKSRGLNAQQAQDLLVEGFVNEIIEKIQQKIPDFQLGVLN